MIYARTSGAAHPVTGTLTNNTQPTRIAHGVNPQGATWTRLTEIDPGQISYILIGDDLKLVTKSLHPGVPVGALLLHDSRLSRKLDGGNVNVMYATGYLAARALARIRTVATGQIGGLEQACRLTSSLLLLGLQTHDGGDPEEFHDERRLVMALNRDFGTEMAQEAFGFIERGNLRDRLGRPNAYRLVLMFAAAKRRWNVAKNHYLNRQIQCHSGALRLTAALDWEVAALQEVHGHFVDWQRSPSLTKDPQAHQTRLRAYRKVQNEHLPRLAARLEHLLLAPHVEHTQALAHRITEIRRQMATEPPTDHFRVWLTKEFSEIASTLRRLILRAELEEAMQAVALVRDPRPAIQELAQGLGSILARTTLDRGQGLLKSSRPNLAAADMQLAARAESLTITAKAHLSSGRPDDAYLDMRRACIILEGKNPNEILQAA